MIAANGNMFVNRFVAAMVLLCASIALAGCSPGATDSSSQKNTANLFSKVVQTFPDNFFNQGYIEQYAVTGSDSNGKNYTGSFEIKTDAKTIFNGYDAIPVESTLSYTLVREGASTSPIRIVLKQFYSTSTPVQYLGSQNASAGVITTPEAQLTDIPSLIAMAQSGLLGDYIGTDASVETISWSVSELDPDNYGLVFHNVGKDSSGSIFSDESQTFRVSPDGTRTGWKLKAVVPSLAVEFDFTGTRVSSIVR